MKKIWAFLIIAFLMQTCLSLAISKGQKPFEYDTRNPPRVWFFPEKEAKWRGDRITIKDWNILIPEQKRTFVEEYIDMALVSLNDEYLIMKEIDPDYHLMALEIFRSQVKNESVEMYTIILTSLIANGDIEKRPDKK